MARVRMNLSVSLDGFLAGPDADVDSPLGRGGEALHRWAFATRTFRSMHGMEGGGTGPGDDVARRAAEGVRATIMGRRMFGGEVPWGDDPWRGWWGDDPPFHHPVFVLTHHPRPPLEMAGGTTFHFVTEGAGAALARAVAAVGDGVVNIGGGADVAQQYLRAGVVDELFLTVAPCLLGGGRRLLEGVGDALGGHDCARIAVSPEATHYLNARR